MSLEQSSVSSAILGLITRRYDDQNDVNAHHIVQAMLAYAQKLKS